jgi:hypothetical protein
MIEYLEEYDNILSDELCDEIISNFLKEKNTHEGQTSGGVNKSVKNTTDFHLQNNCTNDEWVKIDDELYKKLNYCVTQYRSKYKAFEFSFNELKDTGFQIQRYIKNEGFYIDHNDFRLVNNEYRTLTFLFYLNDVDEGGETDFLFGKVLVKPKKGKCILFPASWMFPHKGCIPISNDKYIITGWFYSTYK